MSQPSDYKYPFPDAVEVFEGTVNDFVAKLESDGQLDACFLVQEQSDKNNRWYIYKMGASESARNANAWNVEMLKEADYEYPKRFHILPPLEQPELVQPVTGDDPPGLLMFKLLAGNPLPVRPDLQQAIKARDKRIADFARNHFNGPVPDVRLMAVIECWAGPDYAAPLSTSSERSEIVSILDKFRARYLASLPKAPVNSLNQNLKVLVERHIGNADQTVF